MLQSKMPGAANCHTLRRSFASHILDTGTNSRPIQTLLGHRGTRATMTDTHLVDRGPSGRLSPLEH